VIEKGSDEEERRNDRRGSNVSFRHLEKDKNKPAKHSFSTEDREHDHSNNGTAMVKRRRNNWMIDMIDHTNAHNQIDSDIENLSDNEDQREYK
jgi:hypothetical protein